MDWIHYEISKKSFLSPIQQPYFLSQSPPPPPNFSSGFNLNNKVSPSILLIIIILAIIFFVCGLLHLLVRFLLRPTNRTPEDLDDVTALQGQLQQLFNLHDAGVDQSYIDTLPVFSYKSIIGVKDPFDCAVCLCEFEGEDRLRLLPKCSHAFHMECIDTWLLSHSTCPLCRASLLQDFSPTHQNCSPIVFVLESESNENSREIVVQNRDAISSDRNEVGRVGSYLSTHCGDIDEPRFNFHAPLSKSCEIQAKDVETHQKNVVETGEKVLQVKLGKYKNVDCVGGEGSNNNNSSSIDSRRCFSMGSFAYVMEENTSLHIPIRTPIKKQSNKKPCLPLTPGHKPAMSEYGGCNSRRFFNGLEGFKILELQNSLNGEICTNDNDHKAAIGGGNRRESFSVSKIWLREKKDRPNSAKVESSRRAVSFRFPLHQNVVAATKNGGGAAAAARRTVSEIGLERWGNGRGSEWGGGDVEVDSCISLDSQASAPSFARRTLLWLMGRQTKVVDSNFSSNV